MQNLESSEKGDDCVEWNHRSLNHFWSFLRAESSLEKSRSDIWIQKLYQVLAAKLTIQKYQTKGIFPKQGPPQSVKDKKCQT